MAIRKIEYTVSADGISPSVKQFAGVQGDHKATEIVFNIQSTLYENLKAQSVSDGAKLVYRLDGYDGEGGVERSDTSELTNLKVTYSLEQWLTAFGGTVKVVLVISLSRDDSTELELYSFPALLQLKNSPEGAGNSNEGYRSMSTLAEIAKNSAKISALNAEKAVEAQGKTELAKAALESGITWIFDGGNSSENSEIDIKCVVDGEMSGASDNAIANNVVKAYVDNAIDEMVSADEDLKEYVNNKTGIYVVEQGSKQTTDENGEPYEFWTYRIWSNDFVELWANVNNLTAAVDNGQNKKHTNKIWFPITPLNSVTCRYTITDYQKMTDSTAWPVRKSFIHAYDPTYVEILIYCDQTTDENGNTVNIAENISMSLKIEGWL